MLSLATATLAVVYLAVQGLSMPLAELVTAQQNITFLTTSQIDFFTPYTWYASTAYCAPQQTAIWNCGANCDANPHFNPVASGGDGIEVQYWYVGYDSILQTVIVAHQGTIVNNVVPLLTDVEFVLAPLDPSLFPGVSTDIEVHSGFSTDQAKSAKEVLAAVERTMSQYNCTSVTIVGHSLGGAIALIDSVYLPLWLPQDISFTTITYGLPRVGNPAFAAYVDAHTNLTHVNNKYDPVPTVPPQFTGYAHPNGEVHIEEGDWAVCPGHDNPSPHCIVGAQIQSLKISVGDHWGPYTGVMMGCPYNHIWDLVPDLRM